MARFLCPIDFSDISRHALKQAIVIAGRYGSQIVALHVEDPVLVPGAPAPYPLFLGDVPPDVTSREPLCDRLRDWLSAAKDAGLRTGGIIDAGNPAGCILEHARSW